MCLSREAKQIQEHFSLLGSSNSREFGKRSYGAAGLPADVPLRLVVSLSLPLNVLLCAGCCAAQSVPHYLFSLPLSFVFAVAEWQRAAEPPPSNLL